MKRVQNDDDWYLFDPARGPRPRRARTARRSPSATTEYVASGRGRRAAACSRRSRRASSSRRSSSPCRPRRHPWLTWKDTINNRALNNNTGTIHLSNLCTEITPAAGPRQRRGLQPRLDQPVAAPARRAGAASTSTGSRSRPASPCASSTTSSTSRARRCRRRTSPTSENRAVGLGRHGLHRHHRAARRHATSPRRRTSSSTRSWSSSPSHAIDAVGRPRARARLLPELRRLRLVAGPGAVRHDRRWPRPTAACRSRSTAPTRLDWDALRTKVKGGMRNATLMAIAPTASIGLVAGTTPGPRPAVLADLQPRDLDRQVPRGQPQPRRATCRTSGSGSDVRGRPARAGRHPKIDVDPGRPQGRLQDARSSSRRTRSSRSPRAPRSGSTRRSAATCTSRRATSASMMDLYFAAWERGVKTTYYLHMKPRHTAEQSTVRVNKAEELVVERGGGGLGLRRVRPARRRRPRPRVAASAGSHRSAAWRDGAAARRARRPAGAASQCDSLPVSYHVPGRPDGRPADDMKR